MKYVSCIDFDSREALARGKQLGLPDGPTVKTGRGFHLYCQYSDGVRNFQKRADLPEIDLRGEGVLELVARLSIVAVHE